MLDLEDTPGTGVIGADQLARHRVDQSRRRLAHHQLQRADGDIGPDGPGWALTANLMGQDGSRRPGRTLAARDVAGQAVGVFRRLSRTDRA